MARCPECDEEISYGDELCPKCGAVLADYEEYDTSEGNEGFEA